MNKLLITILLLAVCVPVMAQVDRLPSIDDADSAQVVNTNFENLDGRIRTAQNAVDAILPIDLSLYGTTVTGFLPITGGGTGAGTAQTAIDALTGTGTSGYVWTTSGTNGSWQPITTPALTLISTTTTTAAQNTANISITAGKNYLVVYRVFGPGDGAFSLEFNGAATNCTSSYAWSNITSPDATLTYTSAGITLGGAVDASSESARYFEGSFRMISRSQTADRIMVAGETFAENSAASIAYVGQVQGRFAGTATSFRFHWYDGGGNVMSANGKIWLYEITQ